MTLLISVLIVCLVCFLNGLVEGLWGTAYVLKFLYKVQSKETGKVHEGLPVDLVLGIVFLGIAIALRNWKYAFILFAFAAAFLGYFLSLKGAMVGGAVVFNKSKSGGESEKK